MAKHIEDEIRDRLKSIDSIRSTFLVKLSYGSVEVREVDNRLIADISGNIRVDGCDFRVDQKGNDN